MADPLRVLGIEDGTGCGYYRIRQPFDEMARNGLDVRYLRQYHPAEHSDYPIIVAQRMGYPGFELDWLKMWRRHRLVWETDDDLWNIDQTNGRAHRLFTPQFLRAVEHCASTAHLVTVTSEPLAEVMRRFNPNVVVIPNHVEAGLFDLERPRNERLTVGWAGGDSHLRDWQMVAPHVRRFLRKHPGVDFHMIGTDFRPHTGLEAARFTNWSNDLFDYYRGIDFDIGIAPLVSSVFNESKSFIKALEYAALGIPVIASDEAPYRAFVIDGVTGFLVRHEHEWFARLRDLTNDHAMREAMGAKAKEHARSYSITEGWRLWESAYRQLQEK